jgi:hypothetical protein
MAKAELSTPLNKGFERMRVRSSLGTGVRKFLLWVHKRLPQFTSSKEIT